MKVLKKTALKVTTVGLALGAALVHPWAITLAQAQVDPTVPQINWGQAQPVDV
ncbi:MAG TPA: hypothetical protein IGR64_11340, partial [Leptolyngbyaceae cyanobacterium M65_K2018_010]|nr:hypothetical protein [Leptolyngbyaceae cyanobacterium M65_K2018_010]